LPAIKKALGDLTGSVDGGSFSWKKMGDWITQKAIPVLSQMIKVWLPQAVNGVKAVIVIIKAVVGVISVFASFVRSTGSIVLTVFSAMARTGAAMLRALSHVPGFGWAKGAADKLDNAANKADKLKRNMNNIPRNVGVTVRIATVGGRIRLPNGKTYNAGMRAGGGPVVRDRPYLVGEHGPELWSGGTGHITPARQTAQILAGRGGGTASTSSSTYGGPEVVQVVIDGKVVGQALLRQQRLSGPIGLR